MSAVTEVSLDAFREEHARELVLMWRESFEFGVGVTDPHPLEEQERALLAVVVPNNAVRVAFLERQIVGFVAASATSISQLYVRKGFHRRGIGSLLLEWAKGQSGGSLWLYTFERNIGARAFYERHGFKIVSRGHEPNWKLDDLRYEWVATGNEHMVFALDGDNGGLVAFSSPVEAAALCKGIDVKDGFWLFFAEDGSPLEARFDHVNPESTDFPGAYILQRAMSGLWLQERLDHVVTVNGCGLITVADLVETLKANRGKRAAGKARRG